MSIYHTLVHEFGKEQTNTAIITCCTTMSNESDTSNNPRLNEEILARKPMPGEYPDISLLRRQFLQLPALGLFSLVPTADYSNIMLRFNSAFSRQQLSIDDHLLQHFEYRSRHFWQSRHASLLSLVDLWHAVTQHLHKMLTYLDNPLLPQKRAHLCAILSKTAQLAGVLAYDAGQLHVARSWYALAIQAAQESDEQGLIAIASGWMTFTWLSDQDYNQGLLSVQRAAEIARHTSDGFLIAWLQAIEAEIQIHRQEPAACLAALKQAEGLSDASIKDEHFYLFDFDPTQLQGYQGICLQQLYQKDNPTTHPYLRDAQQVLEQAVASSIPIRRRATYLHDLAGVFARKGEIEAACALIAQSLPLLIELGEGEKTTQLRLVGARNQLSLAADSTAVRTLDEQIACLNENVVKNL